jgi:hypothetical protein
MYDPGDAGSAARGYRRTAEANSSDPVALFLDSSVVGSTDRAGDAAAELKIRIGGINDGVGVLIKEVALDDGYFVAEVDGESRPAH